MENFKGDMEEVKTSEQLAARSGPDLDIDMAIGSTDTGIGAIKKSSDSSGYADWGLAISGNGLMAEAAAVGVLRALNTAGVLEKLATISSVSGGTWFNSQFAFNKDYYEGVISDSSGWFSSKTAQQQLTEWYNKYQMSAMGGMGNMSSWESMITGMHNGFGGGQDTMPATHANRAGNKHADLLLSTTLVGGSLMSDGKTVVQMETSGENAFYSNPAFWLVSEEKNEWVVPGVDMKNTKWENTLTKESTNDANAILHEPTVTKISAMSSAANGITANPELSDLFEPQDHYEATFGPKNSPTNGVCTTPGATCEFPSMMAIDGCYTDNLGFALNVGHLQKKFPGQHLRMMGVSALICDRTSDPTCLNGVKASAFRSLFKDAPYSKVEGWLPAIVPGPDRTIFAESITDEQALGQQTGHGGMTFVTGTFTTIQNDRFGVTAGTKVTILILNVNGPTYLQPMGPGVPEGGMDGLSSVAVHAYNSINQIFGAVELNDEVTSESAFLYFQNVKGVADDS